MISKTQINKKAQRKNQELKEVIFLLKKASRENPKLLLVAKYLSFPRKKKIEVSLKKINKICKNGETIVVPGKVLKGDLDKKIELVAFKISEGALKNLEKSGSKFVPISEFVKQNKKNFRIII